MRKFQEGATMQVAMIVRDLDAAMKQHWDVSRSDRGTSTISTRKGEGLHVSRQARDSLLPDRHGLERRHPARTDPAAHRLQIYDEHLERRGEGLHHIKLYYADCHKAVAGYAKRGYPVIQSGRFDEDEHYYLDTEKDFGYIVELGNAGRIRPAERRYPG